MYTLLHNVKLVEARKESLCTFSPRSPCAPPLPFPKPVAWLSPKSPPQSPRLLHVISMPPA